MVFPYLSATIAVAARLLQDIGIAFSNCVKHMTQYIKQILLVCLSIVLLSACAHSKSPGQSKPPVQSYPHSDIEIKYAVRHFEADLVQSVPKFEGNYLSREQLETIIRNQFISLLKEQNLLAAEGDINVVDLDIFVDYSRRFVGDATPFPVEKMVSPIIALHESSYLGDVVIRSKVTSGMALDDVFNGLTTHNIELEHKTAQAIANSLMKRLNSVSQYDKNAFAAITAGMSAEQIKQKRRYTKKEMPTKTKPAGLASEQYLPEELVQSYLLSLTEGNAATRINLYKQLISEWNNSTAVYDAVNTRVLTSYQSTAAADVEEMIWATKALAYSGIERYRSILDTVMASDAPQRLQDYVKNYLETMTVRSQQAKVIHDVSTMYPELDWQTNQLMNMLNSGDGTLRLNAVKIIYKQQPNNERLLDELSDILQREAKVQRNRYAGYSDFYAWSCRVLGSSGNAKYKAVLIDLADNAYTYKVREFADKFAGKL